MIMFLQGMLMSVQDHKKVITTNTGTLVDSLSSNSVAYEKILDILLSVGAIPKETYDDMRMKTGWKPGEKKSKLEHF